MKALVLFGGAFCSQLRSSLATSLRAQMSGGGCPLCAAAEQCQEQCSTIRSQPPGSEYCLNACTFARPGDDWGEQWFDDVDQKAQADKKDSQDIQDFIRNS